MELKVFSCVRVIGKVNLIDVSLINYFKQFFTLNTQAYWQGLVAGVTAGGAMVSLFPETAYFTLP
jgi:hypothetical protein